jgi:hypothetical protein
MKFPEQFRWKDAPGGYQSQPGEQFGFFLIPGRHANGRALKVMADDGATSGWEHASVTLFDGSVKCPSWIEMSIIKDLFWDNEQTVVQFHPPKSDYVNQHPGCLHLWRCVKQKFPRPPAILVGGNIEWEKPLTI